MVEFVFFEVSHEAADVVISFDHEFSIWSGFALAVKFGKGANRVVWGGEGKVEKEWFFGVCGGS